MAYLITESATVMCVHGGTVQVAPSQTKLKVSGTSVLVKGDLEGKPIIGCTLAPSQSTKPCTATTQMLLGMAMKAKVDGKAALLDNAQGVTDSVPPGTWSVQASGQTKVQAS